METFEDVCRKMGWEVPEVTLCPLQQNLELPSNLPWILIPPRTRLMWALCVGGGTHSCLAHSGIRQ